jgi:uncharacterized cupredoxin-like copper-binding protein
VRKRLILGLLAGAALTLALTACGGSDDDDAAGEATAAPQATSAAATAAATPAPAAAATTAPTQAAAAAPQAIELRAGDFFYEPSTLNAKAGTIVVTMQNVSDGNRPHTFIVKGKDGSDMAKTDRIMPGQTGKLEFTIREAGTYEYYCNLPGHADRGQKGTLTVTS